LAASLKWTFDPIEVPGNHVRVVGTFAFNFKFTDTELNLDIAK
jgi:hypothetical protein